MKSLPAWKDAASGSRNLFRLFVLLSFCQLSLAASGPVYSLAYQAETTSANTLSPGIARSFPIYSTWRLDAATSLRLSSAGLEIWEYKGQFVYALNDTFEISTRLSRQMQFTSSVAHTAWTSIVSVYLPRSSGLLFWGSFGWYQRFSDLHRATVLPIVWGDYSTHDFVAEMGVKVPISNWLLGFKLSHFDELETYNFNHPFTEIRLEIPKTTYGDLSIFARYQVTLGFGRLDRFVTGLTLSMPLEPIP